MASRSPPTKIVWIDGFCISTVAAARLLVTTVKLENRLTISCAKTVLVVPELRAITIPGLIYCSAFTAACRFNAILMTSRPLKWEMEAIVSGRQAPPRTYLTKPDCCIFFRSRRTVSSETCISSASSLTLTLAPNWSCCKINSTLSVYNITASCVLDSVSIIPKLLLRTRLDGNSYKQKLWRRVSGLLEPKAPKSPLPPPKRTQA